LVWLVAIFGCECWTFLKKDQKYIEAFEVYCYRRLQRTAWTKHETNECVFLKKRKVKKKFWGGEVDKDGLYGRVVWKKNNLEKEVIRGCTSTSGSRSRSRGQNEDDGLMTPANVPSVSFLLLFYTEHVV